MKDILVSIAPKWCEKIAEGKKLGEIRKTAPKVKPPFRCFIYCTLPPRSELFRHSGIVEYANELIRLQSGEIVYSYGMQLACDPRPYTEENFLCRKVIGEFVCNSVEVTQCFAGWECPKRESIIRRFCEHSCVTEEKLREYAGGKALYLWNITQLTIYDRPRKLGDFRRPCENSLYCESCAMFRQNTKACGNAALSIKRPPQSWCYVEEVRK